MNNESNVTTVTHRGTGSATSDLTVAVLGANGDAGRAITSWANAAGHTTIAVTRNGQPHPAVPTSGHRGNTHLAAADLLDGPQTIAACRGADVIVVAAQPPYSRWKSELGTIVDNAIGAAAATAARLVMMDNLYMYAPAEGPISEASPEHAPDTKGALRREVGERLLDAHRRGHIRAVIGRQSDFYGPGARNSALWMMGIRPGLSGKTMRALFDADHSHTFAYLPDTAEAIGRLISDPSGDGAAWILPAADPITQRELLSLVGRELTRHGIAQKTKIGTLSAWLTRTAGIFNAQIRESMSVRPQFEQPWITDWSAFVDQYGAVAPTPHEHAVAATVDYEVNAAHRAAVSHPV